MLVRAALVVTVLTLTAAGAVELNSNAEPASDPGTLTVHEWGTFTTVAGPDGHAVDWLPLGGPTDLPCFVEHFQNRSNVKLTPDQLAPLDYAGARANLWGKVRMETPVLYFYAQRSVTASVRVRFPRGLMTEWYPRATVTQPNPDRTTLRNFTNESLIEWRNVAVMPNASLSLPVGRGESHYYPARNTDAAPVLVEGQAEKFLFYRGVASFDVPLSAKALDDGRVRVRNLDAEEIPGLIVFANRGGSIRYRSYGAVRREPVVGAPDRPGTVPELQRDLERMLVNAGLYPKEAAAMVESWRDSWFEEGTRVFYIVPPRAVDAILPLTVSPAPARVARAFVGRMEVITRDTERAVERAVVENDRAALERHARFLGAIADRLVARQPDVATRARIRTVTDAAFASYLRSASTCR